MFKRNVRSSITSIIIVTLLIMSPVVFAETEQNKVKEIHEKQVNHYRGFYGRFYGGETSSQTEEDRVKATQISEQPVDALEKIGYGLLSEQPVDALEKIGYGLFSEQLVATKKKNGYGLLSAQLIEIKKKGGYGLLSEQLIEIKRKGGYGLLSEQPVLATDPSDDECDSC
jgi:hypothetical protein